MDSVYSYFSSAGFFRPTLSIEDDDTSRDPSPVNSPTESQASLDPSPVNSPTESQASLDPSPVNSPTESQASLDPSTVDSPAESQASHDPSPVNSPAESQASRDPSPVNSPAESQASRDPSPVNSPAESQASSDSSPVDSSMQEITALDLITDEEDRAIKSDLFNSEYSTTETFMRAIGRPIILATLFPLTYKSILYPTGNKRTYDCGVQMLEDLGAKKTIISLGNEEALVGHFIKAVDYQANKERVFTKWKPLLSKQENSQIAQTFEINPTGYDMASWLGLPHSIKECETSSMLKGCFYIFGAGATYEFNPHHAVIALEKGLDTFMFNFRGVSDSLGSPNFKNTCRDAVIVSQFLKNELECDYDQLVGHGISLGAAPLVYAGVHCKGLNIALDRAFCRMSEAAKTKLSSMPTFIQNMGTSYMEKFYTYPSEELLHLVKGRVLIIQAEKDSLMLPLHYERLFAALVKGKLGDNPTEAQVEELKKKSWLIVPGGHASLSSGEPEPSWISDHGAQANYNKFYEEE